MSAREPRVVRSVARVPSSMNGSVVIHNKAAELSTDTTWGSRARPDCLKVTQLPIKVSSAAMRGRQQFKRFFASQIIAMHLKN